MYFFHLGNWAKYDRQILYDSKEMKELINFVSAYSNIGIHPSYKASEQIQTLEIERNRLEELTGEVCTHSRMHYLKLKLPETYQMLAELGIKHDYTMGFADSPGFRAGTSMPFNFFDLNSNRKLDITLHPLSVMESSFIYYLNTTPEESIIPIRNIIDEVRNVGGTFISLWHNQSLGENAEWKDWRNLFLEMIKYV